LVPAVVEVRLQLVAGRVAEQLSVPSLTVTVPLGLPTPGEVTVIEKVTAYAWPTAVAEDSEFVIAAAVLALLTVWEVPAEVLLLKFVSPA
jgi:hypothetical protein